MGGCLAIATRRTTGERGGRLAFLDVPGWGERFARGANNPPFAVRLQRMGQPFFRSPSFFAAFNVFFLILFM
jgi:hypothetical protein